MELLSGGCPSKALLLFFSRGKGELFAYRAYLKKTLNLNLSHSNLSELNDDLLGKFFSLNCPEKPPKYFSLDRGADLAMLEAALNLRFIVARPGASCKWTKIHHREIYDVLSGQKGLRETFRFILDFKKGEWQLFYCPENLFGYTPAASEIKFVGRRASHSCYLAAVCELMDCDFSQHEHSAGCSSLEDFLRLGEEMGRLLGKRRVIVVSHIGSEPIKKICYSIKRQIFGQLALFGGLEEEEDIMRVRGASVVAVDLQGGVYLPQPAVIDCVLNLVPRRRTIKDEKYPDLKADVKKNVPKLPRPPPPDYGCRCDPCRDAPLYGRNMGTRGPPRLLRTPMSSFDILKTLGWNDKENEDLINRVAFLSTCYYDIEASSIPVPGCGNEDADFPFKRINDVSGPAKVLARQQPILIGVLDASDLERDAEPQIFRVKKEGSVGETIREFTDEVFRRRDESAELRARLLEPITARIEKFKEAYFNFFAERGWAEENEAVTPKARELVEKRLRRKSLEIQSSWDNTLWGLLASKLKYLTTSFHVFAYNSEAVRSLLVSFSPD
jgi:hypothetical protein